MKRLCLVIGFLSFCALTASLIIGYGASNYMNESNFAVVTKKTIPTFKSSKEASSVELKEGDRLQIMDEKYTDRVNVSSSSGDTYIVNSADVELI